MKNQKISLDHVVYSSIINGCLYNKKIEFAHKCLTESVFQNIKLQENVYHKYFMILLQKSTNLKTKVKCNYIQEIYPLLKSKNLYLNDETVKSIASFISHSK